MAVRLGGGAAYLFDFKVVEQAGPGLALSAQNDAGSAFSHTSRRASRISPSVA